MKSDDKANDVSNASPPPREECCPEAQLQAECERLRQRLAELETERASERRRLQELESERDHYRAEAYAWVRKEFERQGMPSKEELSRIEQKDGLPLEAFLGELERLAKGS